MNEGNPGPERVFLGWHAGTEGGLLARAADWLAERHGHDLSGVTVVVPGARAGRRLIELLAGSAGPQLVPPRVKTPGAVSDELVRVGLPTAGRLARTLVWEAALRKIDPARLEGLVRQRPLDGESWLRLAETVRTLHGELAPEGLDFKRVAAKLAVSLSAGEELRWHVLAEVQAIWRRLLGELDLADPHEARLAAVEAGEVDRDARVVLVGIADLNHLVRRVLDRLAGGAGHAGRVTALVFAPEALADSFDAFGCVVTEAWRERDVELDLERWHLAEKPIDQAERMRSALAGWDGRYAPEEITIGVADEEVAPYLARQLATFGVRARDAAGTPIARTSPDKLLAAVEQLAERGDFRSFAALVRHPALASFLFDDDHGGDGEAQASPHDMDKGDGGDNAAATVLSTLDEYKNKHLPWRVPEYGSDRWAGGPRLREPVASLHAKVGALLGALGSSEALPGAGGERPLVSWPDEVRALLTKVYGERELDLELEHERVLYAALSAVGDALSEVEDLPPSLGEVPVTAADALGRIRRALRGVSIAPAAPRPGETTVEMLGWLELPLDDAPALVLTGFNDGKVPSSVQGDAFLPNGVRRALGLKDNEDRLARDLYALTLLLNARAEVVLISGRKSGVGDPLAPSRLIFHAPEEETLRRVGRYLRKDAVHRSLPPSDVETKTPWPMLRCVPLPETISVTGFSAYLQSPYDFYLRNVVKLRTVEEGTPEMDALGYGNLAHNVLEVFGNSDLRDACDPGAIAAFLGDALRRRVADLFGRDPLPAVTLQVRRLEHRLRRFARWHAERASDGWQVLAVEWKPTGGGCFTLDVDGAPCRVRGKIDRIDKHPDGRWAVLDYKTGEKVKPPDKVHRRSKRWVDLQLPLYRELVRELALQHGLRGEPELGYVALCRDLPAIGALRAEWTRDELDEALEAARTVVRGIRKGDFFRGDPPRFGAIYQAIAGVGLLSAGTEEDE